jgi:hypothetical protein
MTLKTLVVADRPVDARRLFSHCRLLLSAGDDVPIEEDRGGDRCVLRHPPDQGLPTWLQLGYGIDGPMSSPYSDEAPYGPLSDGRCALWVSFDNSGTDAENGATREDLHAYLVSKVGEWLELEGADWYWRHEYTGQWHHRAAGISQLGDPARGAPTIRWRVGRTG